MTVFDAMKARALAEFDRLVAEQEAYLRTELTSRRLSEARIKSALALQRRRWAKKRKAIGRLVTVELMKVGVPLEMGAVSLEGASNNVGS